jgi:UDP-galactopyranose mutase
MDFLRRDPKISILYLGSILRAKLTACWLPHINIDFKWETMTDEEWGVPTPVLYYCNIHNPPIRAVRHKLLTGGYSNLVHKEIPSHFDLHRPVPFYPKVTPEAMESHKFMLNQAKSIYPKLIPLGRIANFKYLDMWQAVKNGIEVANGLA